MTCANLVSFADGELEPTAAAAFRDHLRSCEACQRGLIEAQQLSARLSAMAPARDDPKYHLRVARSARIVAPNVLWFDWCGYVYAEPSGTYDLSIFLWNCAIGGALRTAGRTSDCTWRVVMAADAWRDDTCKGLGSHREAALSDAVDAYRAHCAAAAEVLSK